MGAGFWPDVTCIPIACFYCYFIFSTEQTKANFKISFVLALDVLTGESFKTTHTMFVSLRLH